MSKVHLWVLRPAKTFATKLAHPVLQSLVETIAAVSTKSVT